MDMIVTDRIYDDLRDDDMQYGVAAAPHVLLLGDDKARTQRLAGLIEAAGATLATSPLADTADRIAAEGSRTAAILIDAGHDGAQDDGAPDGGGTLDAALAAIEAGVRTARFAAIIVAPAAMIDIVVARIGEPGIVILIDPDDRHIAEALAHATRPVSATLSDSAGEAACRRLVELGEEVGQIARGMMAASGATGVIAATADAGAAVHVDRRPADPALSDLAVVRAMLRLRRLRTRFLEPSLFADPAWDMLLDLMAAQLERRRVAVSSLCIAAAVPPTTALRWITAMTEQGLFVREPDPADGRRIFIALSAAAHTALAGYIAAARGAFMPG